MPKVTQPGSGRAELRTQVGCRSPSSQPLCHILTGLRLPRGQEGREGGYYPCVSLLGTGVGGGRAEPESLSQGTPLLVPDRCGGGVGGAGGRQRRVA